MKTIYLKDHTEAVKEECLNRNTADHDYSPKQIDEAIQAQIGNELRYSNGKTHDKQFGVCAEYVNKSEAPKYSSEDEAAKSEFSGHVRNSASRVKRGYTAI